MLRATDPAASLTDARSSLAGQYGFRSWSALTAEVARRAGVPIPVLDPEAAAAVAGWFGLGAVIGEASMVERTATATTYRLDSELGRWLVKQPHAWLPGDGADTALAAAVVEAGVPTPRPVGGHDGRYPADIAGRRWRVFTWLDTGPAVSRPVEVDIAAAMGTVLARLHAAAPRTREPVDPWLAERPAPSVWPRLHAAAVARGVAWADALGTALAELVDVAVLVPEPPVPDEQAVLCHANLVPASLRRFGPAGLAVLDFEHAGPLLPRWELGYVLAQWTTGEHEDRDATVARALVEAYRTAGGSPGPLELSMFTTTVTAVLNWTANQVASALDDDAEDLDAAAVEVTRLLRAPLSRRRLAALLSAVS